MAIKYKQYYFNRYVDEGDSEQVVITEEELEHTLVYSLNSNLNRSKNIFSDLSDSIVRIGIQGKPGTEFSLNEYYGEDIGVREIDTRTKIGPTGVFELDLVNLGLKIFSLEFVKPTSLKKRENNSMQGINNSNISGYDTIIVDVLYEEAEEEEE